MRTIDTADILIAPDDTIRAPINVLIGVGSFLAITFGAVPAALERNSTGEAVVWAFASLLIPGIILIMSHLRYRGLRLRANEEAGSKKAPVIVFANVATPAQFELNRFGQKDYALGPGWIALFNDRIEVWVTPDAPELAFTVSRNDFQGCARVRAMKGLLFLPMLRVFAHGFEFIDFVLVHLNARDALGFNAHSVDRVGFDLEGRYHGEGGDA